MVRGYDAGTSRSPPEAAKAIEGAIEVVIADKNIKTRDIGGIASTEEMGATIAEEISIRPIHA